MTRIGRNDPCLCGSGKKYKKCCLTKEAILAEPEGAEAPQRDQPEQRDRISPSPPMPPNVEPAAQQDDEKRFWDRFWRDLDRAGPDKKVQMVDRMIEVRDDFDGQLAFALVQEIIDPLRRVGRAADVDRIIGKIEQLHPDVYREELCWMSGWRAENALLQADGDVATPLAQLAQGIGRSIDEASRIIDRLRYHGRVRELTPIMLDAVPDVMGSHEIMEWGKWEFRDVAFTLVLGKHLERDPRLRPDAPAFLKESAPVRPEEPERLRHIVAHATGRADRRWRPEDFRGEPWDRLAENLFFLSLDFGRELHDRWGWPRSRADLARHTVQEHVSERVSERRGRKPAVRLEPDPEAVDQFMAARLSFIGIRPYLAAALHLALAPWMTFLCDLGLMERDDAAERARQIRSRVRLLPRALDRCVFDPVLIEDARLAWKGSA